MLNRSGIKRRTGLGRTKRLRPVSRKGRTIKSLDKLLHDVIKLRDKTCQFTSAGMGPCGGVLQACHIYPKGRHPAMRYLLKNVLLGCWRHHSPKSGVSWHTNPMHYAAWLNRTQPDLAAELLLISQNFGKVPDKKLIRIMLEAELRRLSG